ncbi:MAG: sulfatase-like hydrolase/transferase [Bacteroidia bacterium]|nr:sulfatase-like hydrolase/transferase [Bacteroidia bacterium]
MLNEKFNFVLASLFVAVPLYNAAAQKKTTPNILVIMTDQQRWDALRYSGANNTIQTPNLDKLAREGAYFSQAVSPCPVSGPARTSILTGRLVESTGIRTNMDSDNDKKCNFKTFDQILAANGYIAEYIGKFHSPMEMARVYNNPPQYGYNVPGLIKSWEKLYHFYLNENTKKRQAQNGEFIDFSFFDGTVYKPVPMDRRFDKMPSGQLTDEDLKPRQLSQPDHHGTLNLKSEYSITAVQGRQTIEAIERNKNNKFVITCSFHYPHSPMLPTEPYASMYKPSEMPIPKTISDKMAGNPYYKSNGRLLMPEYADSAKIGYMIANYYALVTEIDDWVGKIIGKLDELKLSQNTLIIFMSDHGEMLGAHGMREKNVFLEESVRVPLIINYPSKISARKIETPVSLLTIFPTILDYAGIKAESDGYSLRALANGEKPSTDFAVSEWNWENQQVPNLMIRTKEWKLLLSRYNNQKNIDALYDLKNDPYELNNLLFTNRGKYLETAEALKMKLVDYLVKVNYSYTEEIKQRVL